MPHGSITTMAEVRGRRAVRLLVILGAAPIILVGVAGLVWLWALSSSNGPPPAIEPAMAAMPEGSLVYPLSTNIHKTGEPTECRDGVWLQALIEFTFTTNDSTHDVFLWYSQQLALLGWSGAIADAGATGYSLTRDTSDLFTIEVNLDIDGSPYRVGDNGVEYTTDFQHEVKTGRC
jgi:hypothetical protein